jgi:hypothetical protein
MRPLEQRLLRTPCSAILLDGRLVRSAVSADDPSCRLIRPLIGKMFGRIKRAMLPVQSATLSLVRRVRRQD